MVKRLLLDRHHFACRGDAWKTDGEFEIKLGETTKIGPVFAADQPWERWHLNWLTVLRDNGKYRMEIYNKAGKKSSTYYFDLDYSGMTADDDEVILYNDGEMLIYQMGGRVRFRGTFNTAVTGVMPSWEDGLYWLIDDQSLREIRIR